MGIGKRVCVVASAALIVIGVAACIPDSTHVCPLSAGRAATQTCIDSAPDSKVTGTATWTLTGNAESGLTAALASTGQQKALLIGLILGHAALIAEARGFAPLLLLDEPCVHLDPERRVALFAALARLPAEALLTGTDAETFFPLRGVAEGLRAGGGELRPDAGFPAVTPVPGAL